MSGGETTEADAAEAPSEAVAKRREAATHLLREAEQEAAEDPIAALRRVRAALALDPECAAAHLVAGELLRRVGQTDEARHHLTEALARQPGLLRARRQLEALDQASGNGFEGRLGNWRREGWLLARRDLAAWLLYDLLSWLLVFIPPGLLVLLPASLSLGGRPADWAQLGADLRAVALPLALVALAAGLWILVAAGCLLTGRLLVMTRLAWWSDLAGRWAAAGLGLFSRTWWQAGLLLATLTGLAGLLGVSLIGWPLLAFLASVLSFAAPLTLLGGRDAFAACSASYQLARRDWVTWLGLLLQSLAAPALLVAAAVSLPSWLIVRAAAEGGAALAAQVGLGLLLFGGLVALAWLAAHFGAMVWMVALRDLFGEDGVALALVELPELLDPEEGER